jgi:VanZ family protein
MIYSRVVAIMELSCVRFRDLDNPWLFPLSLLVTTAILLSTNLPGHYKLVYALQDSGHFLIFTLLSLTALWSYRKRGEGLIWRVMLGCLLFGVLIEGVQSQIGRDPSLYDLLMDLLGIVSGVVLYLGFVRRSFPFGMTLAAVAILALAAFSRPAYWLMVYRVRADLFPRLMDPESYFANGLLEANPGGEINRIDLPENWSIPPELGIHSCIYVSLPGGRWPGIDMAEPEPDWRGYESLNLAIYSDQENDLTLILRIHDRMHNNRVEDRFKRRLTVGPGYNHFSIPLKQISRAPVTRSMDLSAISDVKIFATRDHIGSGFCLLSMGLR